MPDDKHLKDIHIYVHKQKSNNENKKLDCQQLGCKNAPFYGALPLRFV